VVAVALIFDPMGGLVDVVGQIEDALLFADADTDEDVAVLDRGAHAAASLALALRAAAAAGPALIAPDGHTELGPVLRCPAAYRCLPVILAGVEKMHPRLEAGMTALRLIERSCEEAVAANQAVLLDAWPDEPGARWVLSRAEHAAYCRLRNTVLEDALDRFVVG